MRILRRLLIALLLVVLAAAVPIVWVEASCRAPAVREPLRASLIDPAHRRPWAKTFLTYPEWYIVHAYQDFAGVLARSDEASFGYLASIGQYWRSFCELNRTVTARGDDAFDQRVTLYVIGLSFTAEMAVKGLYELTLGALTAWWRGPQRTPEDAFALALAEDYGHFLTQTPWYEYPFAGALARLWREVPFGRVSVVRSLERRVALTLENGVKALYGAAIGAASGATFGADELRIRSVVAGLDASDREADPRIDIVGEAGGATMIETPRYRAFTEVLRGLAARGRDLVEIAGNHEILVTALTRAPAPLAAADAREIFSIPVQARPGYRRAGLVVAVPALLRVMRELPAAGHEIEHVYDY